MKRTLLLAGNSFLGAHLHRALEQTDAEVISTTRARPTDRDSWGRLPTCASRFGFGKPVICDVTDEAQVDEVIGDARPHWIINCAGVTSGGSAEMMDQVHVQGTANVLQAVARHVPDAVVVLLGSAAEYGNVAGAQLPVSEDQPARPETAFGRSKLDQLCRAEHWAAEQRLRILVVRCFNMLGPGLPEHYLAAALTRRLRLALLRGQSGAFPVDNPDAARDWIDVRDVAAALVALLRQAAPSPGRMGLYNIATGQETPVLALAERLCRLAGDFHAVPGEPKPSRSGIRRSCGDATRLRRATGWDPAFSWQQSLEDMWNDASSRLLAHGQRVAQFPAHVSHLLLGHGRIQRQS